MTEADLVDFNVTAHPTAQWTAQQIVEAFPFDESWRCWLRDRDGTYGDVFRCRVESLGIEEVISAAGSPWQNPYAVLALSARSAASSSII